MNRRHLLKRMAGLPLLALIPTVGTEPEHLTVEDVIKPLEEGLRSTTETDDDMLSFWSMGEPRGILLPEGAVKVRRVGFVSVPWDMGKYRVYLDGEDVTDRATAADDIEGWVTLIEFEAGQVALIEGTYHGNVRIEPI